MEWEMILQNYALAYPSGFKIKRNNPSIFFPSNHLENRDAPTQLISKGSLLYIDSPTLGIRDPELSYQQAQLNTAPEPGPMLISGLNYPKDFNVCMSDSNNNQVDFKKIQAISDSTQKRIAFLRALYLMYASETTEKGVKIFIFDPEKHIDALYESHEDITNRMRMHEKT